MRVAISGSPTSSSRIRFSSVRPSTVSRCSSASTPRGCPRYSPASPPVRNCTPWYVVGRKPLPQLELPPDGPLLPVLNTTKPGRSFASLPRPDRKSTRLNSSHMSISYAVFCLKKKNERRVAGCDGGVLPDERVHRHLDGRVVVEPLARDA